MAQVWDLLPDGGSLMVSAVTEDTKFQVNSIRSKRRRHKSRRAKPASVYCSDASGARLFSRTILTGKLQTILKSILRTYDQEIYRKRTMVLCYSTKNRPIMVWGSAWWSRTDLHSKHYFGSSARAWWVTLQRRRRLPKRNIASEAFAGVTHVTMKLAIVNAHVADRSLAHGSLRKWPNAHRRRIGHKAKTWCFCAKGDPLFFGSLRFIDS